MKIPIHTTTAEPVPDIPVDTRSEGIKVITNALVQIELTYSKLEEALINLNEQLSRLERQKIGLAAQRSMCNELKRIIEENEAKKADKSEGTKTTSDKEQVEPSI